MQVFFIRDGFKFPDLVHALRPNPRNNIQEAWRFLDFLSYHPESAHIVSLYPLCLKIHHILLCMLGRALQCAAGLTERCRGL